MSYLDDHDEEVKNASYYRRELKKVQAEYLEELTELREFKAKVMSLEPIAWKIKFKYDKPENCPDKIITLFDYLQMLEQTKSGYYMRPLYNLGDLKY